MNIITDNNTPIKEALKIFSDLNATNASIKPPELVLDNVPQIELDEIYRTIRVLLELAKKKESDTSKTVIQ